MASTKIIIHFQWFCSVYHISTHRLTHRRFFNDFRFWNFSWPKFWSSKLNVKMKRSIQIWCVGNKVLPYASFFLFSSQRFLHLSFYAKKWQEIAYKLVIFSKNSIIFNRLTFYQLETRSTKNSVRIRWCFTFFTERCTYLIVPNVRV